MFAYIGNDYLPPNMTGWTTRNGTKNSTNISTMDTKCPILFSFFFLVLFPSFFLLLSLSLPPCKRSLLTFAYIGNDYLSPNMTGWTIRNDTENPILFLFFFLSFALTLSSTLIKIPLDVRLCWK